MQNGETTAVVSAPAAQDTHNRLLMEVRLQLGQPEFDLATAEGQAASREQILAVIKS
jgi:hypothetical protein